MRVLLVIAAAAVVALLWPREGTRHVDRAPASSVRAARPVEHPGAGGAVTIANPGGETPGMERGRCALRLRLVDQVTGKPFASNVELWRLDLPEDESWTAGDHCQVTGRVRADGGTFTNLPAGRYRVAAHGQSYLADDDPPAFLVRGAVTDLTLPARAPRSHRIYLQVFDERGRELRTGNVRRHRSASSTCAPGVPAWARLRQPKGASASINGRLGMGGGAIGRGDGRPATPWTAAGFDLGRFREDSREQRRTTKLSLLVPGHTAVMMGVGGRLTGDCAYVAVVVSLDELKDLVFLPDGRRAADAGAWFQARCRALEIKPPLSPDAWRSLPVNVRVGLGGYEVLTFEYQVDRRPQRQVMRPHVHG